MNRPDATFWQCSVCRLLCAAALLIGVVAVSACGTSPHFLAPEEFAESGELPHDSTLAYSIFLIGDTGAPHYEGAPEVLALLDTMLAQAGVRSSVVFLGDNIYPSGMPAESSPAREEAETRIDAQLSVVEDHPGHVIFLPGNHDWGGAGLGGDRQAVLRQEAYVEAHLDKGNTFLPDGGFPGPYDVHVDEDIVLIVLDTQWWLENHKPYGNTGTYELELEGEFLLELDDLLWRHADKHRVVVAHHPVFSNGEHGGFFRGARSLLSGERLARGYLGTPQDLSNLKYRRLREGLLSIFEHHRDLVFAAGHEHSLQYFPFNDQHYIVSGSGSKTGHVESGHGALFAEETKGFAALRYHTDGSIWLRFYAPGDAGEADALYTHRLRPPNRRLVAYRFDTEVSFGEEAADASERRDALARPDDDEPDMAAGAVDHSESTDTSMAGEDLRRALDDTPGSASEVQTPYALFTTGTTNVAANRDYERGPLATFVLGDHYRRVWSMEIPVPIIDLDRTAGGLTPIKKGGGLQTTSLRLRGGDGDEYVLRSIDKDPTQTVPEYLRETIAHDVIQDQIAAMHPFGAFILPRLARAAGIFHTSPTLVYVPDDPSLGFYRPLFGGTLAMFESRPDEDQSDEQRFGYAENVIGTAQLFEEIEEDNDERVDQRAYARARLFDMVIGDWDRHNDQWRWSEFDRTPGKIYKPVPRDRDFAFFKFDGFLPNLLKKTGDLRFRRFTNFFRPYDDVFGLNYNGAALDKRLTSSLDRSDWLEIVDSLQHSLTDEVIDQAVRDFPQPVYTYQGERVASMLRERRDRLDEAASAYFDLLASNVDIVGSNKHERFEVMRFDDDSTLVILYKTSREGAIDRELYRRMLYSSETDEVRLYGLDGDDYFHVAGDVGSGVRVRAVGGPGKDTFVDSSSVAGPTHATIFHDSVDENVWVTADETRIERSDHPRNNLYEMTRFELDERRPLAYISRNRDDGIVLGGGMKIIKHGFRKTPFAAEHRLYATAATSRRAFNAFYRGHFVSEFGLWDGYVSAGALADRRFENFYGLGNDSALEDRDFYHARIGRVTVEPSLIHEPLPFTNVRVGPRFDYMNVEPPNDGTASITRFDRDDFTDKYSVGAFAELNIDGTDTLAATQHGARWLNSIQANVGVRNTNRTFVRLASDVSYFNTFYNPTRFTVGIRVGGATNIGDFEFYHANTLGGQQNLRGFRKTRFAGRTAVYSNLDLRVQLVDFNIYLMRGLAGVLGFVDHGRIWPGEGNIVSGWHRGYGGGVWVAPFNKLAFTATIGRSEENTLFDLSFGFQF